MDTLQTRQTTNSNMRVIRDWQRKVKTHSININTVNSYGSRGAWILRSDEVSYPILRKDKNNYWSKYNDYLKNIKVEGDSLQQLHKFWYAMDTSLSSILNSKKGLGD